MIYKKMKLSVKDDLHKNELKLPASETIFLPNGTYT